MRSTTKCNVPVFLLWCRCIWRISPLKNLGARRCFKLWEERQASNLFPKQERSCKQPSYACRYRRDQPL